MGNTGATLVGNVGSGATWVKNAVALVGIAAAVGRLFKVYHLEVVGIHGLSNVPIFELVRQQSL